jgi:hypothetical protein
MAATYLPRQQTQPLAYTTCRIRCEHAPTGRRSDGKRCARNRVCTSSIDSRRLVLCSLCAGQVPWCGGFHSKRKWRNSRRPVALAIVNSVPMRHTITLNVRFDQPQADWDKVLRVYESMPGWRAAADAQSWFGDEGDREWIWASIEPGGILFESKMDQDGWSTWIGELCDRLSIALGRPVHDAES